MKAEERMEMGKLEIGKLEQGVEQMLENAEGGIAGMEKKIEGALHAAEAEVGSAEHQVEDAVERIKARLMRKVERITAVAEEVTEIPRVARDDKAGVRRTLPSFLAKVMAEAESGADGKQIDRMLSGLTVEQRVAVKMQMVKAGMI